MESQFFLLILVQGSDGTEHERLMNLTIQWPGGEVEYCDVCVNRSDDNMLDDNFQVSPTHQ